MKSRLYSEGKSIPLGERWFTRCYAVPIFSFVEGAALRWIKAKTDVDMHAGAPPIRLLRVRTILEMQ